jgi:hypothetical protein
VSISGGTGTRSPVNLALQRSRLLPLGPECQQRLVQKLSRFAEVIDGWPSAPTS